MWYLGNLFMLLRDLSWMGSKYSVSTIKELTASADLKVEAEVALAKLQPSK